VAHRNYFIYGAQIEINIFKDRLEITSPGSLLGVRRLDKEKDISCDDSSFTLTLPDMTYGSGISVNVDDIPEVYAMGMLSGKNDMSILAFCYNSLHSVSEIADYLGMTPSTYFRKNTIKRLVNDGFLIEKISGRKKSTCQTMKRY